MGTLQTSDAADRVRARPWPAPAGRPVMRMRWHDLLFAHWPVDPAALRELIPTGLEIDTFGGEAYVGVIPFHMTGIRLLGLPGVPGTIAFPELNVRTYVSDGERPGVYFLTLDATSRIAIAVARAWFGLNYRRARIRWRREGDAIVYDSARHDGAARFVARYQPVGPAFHTEPGTIEHFLTDRYCLYAQRRGVLVRGEIDHPRWAMHGAAAEITGNTMTEGLGVAPEGEPHLLYARAVESLVWAPSGI